MSPGTKLLTVLLVASGIALAAGHQEVTRTMPGQERSSGGDHQEVASLDLQFQAAVKRNDAAKMAEILHPDMVLVLGDGRISTRLDQLTEARNNSIAYEAQDEEPGSQMVRVNGSTAVVTAMLHVKGHRGALTFDRRLWFSDVYVRTPQGWKYFFGQASLPM